MYTNICSLIEKKCDDTLQLIKLKFLRGCRVIIHGF